MECTRTKVQKALKNLHRVQFVRGVTEAGRSCVTTNQIAYWNLREKERTDRANEAINRESTRRQASAAEKTALANVRNAESNAINAAAKSMEAETNQRRAEEYERHNKVSEGIDAARIATDGLGNIAKFFH